MSEPTGHIDFFISYRGNSRPWALWVNWVVRSAGYSTRLMEEFELGENWTQHMRQAVEDCRRLIPLFTADYWESGACQEEFDAYWRLHMQDRKQRFLCPLSVVEHTPPDIHAALNASRIYGLNRDAALKGVRNVLKNVVPLVAGLNWGEPEPPFPGVVLHAIASDWPALPPDNFRWPLADHGPAREAFLRLVTRDAPHKLLAISGDSQTGKSHLTRQFLNNALRRLSHCAVGRFEFKGTIGIDSGLAEFANHLQVPLASDSGSLQSRLSDTLRSLQQRAQPALLILDGYELAGESDSWVREILLTSLFRWPWLRVVVAGQRVPEAHGHPWEEDTCPILLTPPSPEDWYEWSQENKRNVTLAFVRQLHKAACGRASVIAPVLGPAA